MEYKYTKHQVPRGTKPDLEMNDKIYLIKNVSFLHATYQIRLLTYLVLSKKKKLIIRIPKGCKCSDSLKELINENKKLIKLERM